MRLPTSQAIDAILFDFGGTLYEVSDEAFGSWKRLLREAGFPNVTPEEYYMALNRTRRDVLDRRTAKQVRAGRTPGMSGSDWEAYNRRILENMGLTSDLISADLCHRLTDAMATVRRRYQLLPGTRETLEFLNRHFKLGLISNTLDDLKIYLEEDGILQYFDAIVLSCEVGYWKPDKGIFLRACKLTGVYPDRAVYVGDMPICDYDAAKRAGLHPILKGGTGKGSGHASKGEEITSIAHITDLIAIMRVHNESRRA